MKELLEGDMKNMDVFFFSKPGCPPFTLSCRAPLQCPKFQLILKKDNLYKKEELNVSFSQWAYYSLMCSAVSIVCDCVQVPELDAIIGSVSGGGFLAGMAVAAKVGKGNAWVKMVQVCVW